MGTGGPGGGEDGTDVHLVRRARTGTAGTVRQCHQGEQPSGVRGQSAQEPAVHLGDDGAVGHRSRQGRATGELGGRETPSHRGEEPGMAGGVVDQPSHDRRGRGHRAQLAEKGPCPVRRKTPQTYGLRPGHVGKPVVAPGGHDPTGTPRPVGRGTADVVSGALVVAAALATSSPFVPSDPVSIRPPEAGVLPGRGERGARMGVPEVQVVEADQRRTADEELGHRRGDSGLAPREPQGPACGRRSGREGREQGPGSAPRAAVFRRADQVTDVVAP